MNLVLLFQEDFSAEGEVRLTGRRKEHLTSILKVKPGDRLTVGLCNDRIGEGEVVKTGVSIVLRVKLLQPPPEPLPLTLIMPLPRPPVFKRVLICAASLGIKKIIVLNFSRVEKSLWNSSALKPEAIEEQLILGLEQGKDTRMPEVILKKRFKPFVEDELPSFIKGTLPLVAHPSSQGECPRGLTQPVTLAIGPEGGLIDYEVQALIAQGFQAVDLGPRILKVESALPFIIGCLKL